MNIEKSLDIIKGKLLLIDKMLKQDQEEGRGSAYEMQTEDFEAIETLLTAYEKEKEGRERIGKLYYEANENCIKYEKMIEKEKEKNKRLTQCHYQYEEMTGIDLLLSEKEE